MSGTNIRIGWKRKPFLLKCSGYDTDNIHMTICLLHVSYGRHNVVNKIIWIGYPIVRLPNVATFLFVYDSHNLSEFIIEITKNASQTTA